MSEGREREGGGRDGWMEERSREGWREGEGGMEGGSEGVRYSEIKVVCRKW